MALKLEILFTNSVIMETILADETAEDWVSRNKAILPLGFTYRVITVPDPIKLVETKQSALARLKKAYWK